MKRLGKKFWISLSVAVACAAAITVTLCVLLIKPDVGGINHIVIEPSDPQVNRGELEISLVREKLVTRTLKQSGYIDLHTDETRVDFSKSSANIFGITGNMTVGPGCYFESYMAISNAKEASFEYWLEIKPSGGDRLLADQLELTVKVGEELIVDGEKLGEGLTTAPIARTEYGKVSRFTARLTYIHSEDNNDTQNSTLAFDMVVHARLI